MLCSVCALCECADMPAPQCARMCLRALVARMLTHAHTHAHKTSCTQARESTPTHPWARPAPCRSWRRGACEGGARGWRRRTPGSCSGTSTCRSPVGGACGGGGVAVTTWAVATRTHAHAHDTCRATPPTHPPTHLVADGHPAERPGVGVARREPHSLSGGPEMNSMLSRASCKGRELVCVE